MRNIILGLLVVLLVNCTRSIVEQNSGDITVITIPEKLTPVIFDSIVDNCYWIPLESEPNNLIGQVDKILVSENRIFIQDMVLANAVFVFDKSGQLIKTIRGGGKGPGEFVRPRSISIDFYKNELTILDDRSQKILIFDEDGNFINSVKIKQTSNDFAKISDDVYAFNSGYTTSEEKADYFDLTYIASNSRKKLNFRPLPGWRFNTDFLKANSFSYEKNIVYYSPVFCDTIFSLGTESQSPIFHIDFGDNFINYKTGKDIDFTQPLAKKISSISSFQKAGDFAYFSFSLYEKSLNGRILHHTFVNEKTKKMSIGYALSPSAITHGLFTYPIASTGEEFVGYIDAFDVIQKIDLQLVHSSNIDPALVGLRGMLEPGDNPVLFFYSLKN